MNFIFKESSKLRNELEKVDCLFIFDFVIYEMGDYKSYSKESHDIVFNFPIIDKDDHLVQLDVSFVVAPVEDAPECNEFIFQHLELRQGV
ncbi:hypothetical protein ACL9ST_17745 [Bacillus australimaris]|uniref:hypothetical protein n=1 Tax=Bacillus australimaris TaxID=1326968 RepID=UPI0039B42D65